MLPVSGAEQLNTSGAKPDARPMISQSGAYSVLVSPAPYSLSGRNRFHRPAARAFSFNCSTTVVGCQRSPVGDLVMEGSFVRIDVLLHEAVSRLRRVIDFGGEGKIHIDRCLRVSRGSGRTASVVRVGMIT